MSFPFPFHPVLVHFPIALFISAFIMNLLGIALKKDFLQQSAWHIFILAISITPLTVITGLMEENRLHFKHRILDLHKIFALLTLGTSLISFGLLWLIKRENEKAFRALFLITLLVIIIFVSLAGYFGGRMVYEYGAGVQ